MEEDFDYEEEYTEDDKKKRRRKILFWILFAVTIVAIVLIILSITMCRRNDSNIEVVYDDRGVDAIVRTYSLSNGNLTPVGGEISFDKEKTNPTRTVTMPAVNLNSTQKFTIFMYYFENVSDTDQMKITLDDSNMTSTNMRVTYLVKYDEALNLANGGHNSINSTSLDIEVLNPQDRVDSTNYSAYVYVKVSIDNAGVNGDYVGDMVWILEPVLD